ncbi:hypothetical protein NE619_11490 [Anaerovorax odorimutans]|uniref:Transposase/invertase (TIGR01784 family) n=1 Tax=Anaerovorax odorimutans TaxID=109327 RepID=A0ABT1RQ89_9FIRM|nr:hypothetical protein [Anaerovorax odorimutans]
MQRKIEKIRSSEEIGVKYMNEYEERVLEQQEARQEERKKIAVKLKAKKIPLKEIAEITGLDIKEIKEL